MPKTKAAAPPEVDAPAAKAVGDEKVAVPAAGNNAKKQLSSMFNRVPKPAPKHVRAGGAGSGGDATALSRAQGIVLRVRDDKPVNGPKGPITKRRIDLLPTSIMPNGAQDIVRSGVPGQTFLFPSRVLDTPDAAGAGDAGGYRAKERELVVSPLQTVRQISIISASFYKESKEGGDAGVMSLKVGMMAEVSGICVNASTKGGVTNFYLNAGKVTPMADSGPVGADLGRLMVQHASSEYMQQWSAFGCSLATRGFFDKDICGSLNGAQKSQALAAQAMWARLVSSTASRLEAMASGKDEDLAGQLMGHEQRVRAIDPARLAAGEMNLFLIDKYDVTIAPIVHAGLSPADKTPLAIQHLQGTPEQQAKLPDAFTAPYLAHVAVKGKALVLDFEVAYIFDKQQALESLLDKGDDNPVLMSPGTAVSTTLSMREMGVKLGSLLETKAQMAVNEILPTATFACFPRVYPYEASGEMPSDFPEGGTLFMDMAKTLSVCAIKVSEKYVKEVLCGGGSVRVAPPVPKDAAKYEFPTGVSEMPSLANDGYEELTGASFDVGNWSELDGTIEYRVAFRDVAQAVAGDEDLVNITEQGEAYIDDLAPGGHAKVKAFLTAEALVYAVLVK